MALGWDGQTVGGVYKRQSAVLSAGYQDCCDWPGIHNRRDANQASHRSPAFVLSLRGESSILRTGLGQKLERHGLHIQTDDHRFGLIKTAHPAGNNEV